MQEKPNVLPSDGRTYRVMAEGDDAVAVGLAIEEALAVAQFAREHGKRHVAIVDEQTGQMVDEADAPRVIVDRTSLVPS